MHQAANRVCILQVLVQCDTQARRRAIIKKIQDRQEMLAPGFVSGFALAFCTYPALFFQCSFAKPSALGRGCELLVRELHAQRESGIAPRCAHRTLQARRSRTRKTRRHKCSVEPGAWHHHRAQAQCCYDRPAHRSAGAVPADGTVFTRRTNLYDLFEEPRRWTSAGCDVIGSCRPR